VDLSTLGRIPPHNIEAEQAVLGCMLLDSDIIPTVTELIRSEDFYRDDHKEICDAILDLTEKAGPVDIITVSEQLQLRGTLDAIGGLEYLTNITDAVPTTANARHYAKIVEEKSLLRKLIKASSDIAGMSYDASEEAAFVLDKAEKSIFDILEKRSTQGFTHIKDVLLDTFNRLEELYNSKSFITGVPTGFTDLDYKTAGLQNSDLVLIAARPGMGPFKGMFQWRYSTLKCRRTSL
jgi:replicative DNA helicase